MAYEFCDPLFLGSIWEAIVIPLHRCVCIWTTFLVCFVVVVFVWLLGRFGCPSGWVTYLGQLWMTLDNNNNNNNIHSMVVGDVGSSGSRYVNVRRDLPRLLFFVPFFYCQMYEFELSGFLENSFNSFYR